MIKKDANMVKTPKVLAILPGLVPSTIIDVVTPLSSLHKDGRIKARITTEILAKKRDLDWCDIVVLCRNMRPEYADWFFYLKDVGIPYIYDLDDNFFESRKDPVLDVFLGDALRFQTFQDYIKHADLVRVYSALTKSSVLEHNSKVEEVKSPIDWRHILPYKNKKSNKKINIVYSTSRSQDYLADIFKPALFRILENYSERVNVHFLGYNPVEFKKFRNVKFKPLIFDYEKFLRTFSQAGYDIGLAPLQKDDFHLSKTNNKFREYAACQIGGIYSNVEVYSDFVKQNETGLLVGNDPNEWFDAMAMMIENPGFLMGIQKRAYEYVRAYYSQEDFAEVWFRQILKVLMFRKEPGFLKDAAEPLQSASINSQPGVASRFYDLLLKIFNSILNMDINRLSIYLKMSWVLWKVQLRLKIPGRYWDIFFK